jgi:hypothetical protein
MYDSPIDWFQGVHCCKPEGFKAVIAQTSRKSGLNKYNTTYFALAVLIVTTYFSTWLSCTLSNFARLAMTGITLSHFASPLVSGVLYR